MPRNIDSESQIGRRLRLRDLHLFFTVVQEGSMAKAASRLGISQPAVSEVIAALEDALGVRLFDRNARGVEPTVYGRAATAVPGPGTYKIVVAPGARVLEVLRAHKKLHVVLATTFQSQAGGGAVTLTQKALVALRKPKRLRRQ